MKSDIKTSPGSFQARERRKGRIRKKRELERRGTRSNTLVTSTVNLPTRNCST